MTKKYNVLILGASYGSLLAAKMLLAGHHVCMVCLPEEVDLINREGIRVRLPIKGRESLVELDSRTMPGRISACAPNQAKLDNYDLIGLAMQEPQYRSPGVRELLAQIAKSKIPCMSIMNIPPLPYIARLPGVNAQACREAYADPTVWDSFTSGNLTLCSPDPQAFRPPEEKVNVLQVRLPTNFKAARFENEVHTKIIQDIANDIEAVRFNVDGESIALPVKLKVFDSIYVPLAKWAMLMAGNYRCITKDGARPIKDAVHSDINASRDVYNWVVNLCVTLGANQADLVPFEKYAAAANGLANPSSAARALYGGAKNIERVDRLIQAVAKQKGMQSTAIDEIVTLVDAQLKLNQAQ